MTLYRRSSIVTARPSVRDNASQSNRSAFGDGVRTPHSQAASAARETPAAAASCVDVSAADVRTAVRQRRALGIDRIQESECSRNPHSLTVLFFNKPRLWAIPGFVTLAIIQLVNE